MPDRLQTHSREARAGLCVGNKMKHLFMFQWTREGCVPCQPLMISVQYCNMNSVRKLANSPGFLSCWVAANQTQSKPRVFLRSCICKQGLERQQQAEINVRPPTRLKSQTIKGQWSDKILIRGYWYGNTLSFVNILLLAFGLSLIVGGQFACNFSL